MFYPGIENTLEGMRGRSFVGTYSAVKYSAVYFEFPSRRASCMSTYSFYLKGCNFIFIIDQMFDADISNISLSHNHPYSPSTAKKDNKNI